MLRLSFLTLVVLAANGCALRSRYSDFVTAKTAGPDTAFVLTNKAGEPMANVRVEMSELKNRFVTTTKADGTFALPVDKKYLSEDPVIVVSVPAGVEGYKLALAPPPAPPKPVEVAPVEPAPQVVPAPVETVPASTPATPEKG
jgi:hypothetical protein